MHLRDRHVLTGPGHPRSATGRMSSHHPGHAQFKRTILAHIVAVAFSLHFADTVTASAGCALSFDGGDIATCGQTTALTASGTHTLEAWVKPNTASRGQFLVRQVDQCTFCGEGILLTGGAGPICYSLDAAGCGTGTVVCEHTPSVDVWTHVAGTYVAGVGRLYINGTLVGETTGSFPPADFLRLGAYAFACSPENYFGGELDEVRIWNVARSADEIRSTMFCTLAGDETGLIGYWQMDDCFGQEATNSASVDPNCVLGTSSSVQSSDPRWIASGVPIVGTCPLTCSGGLCVAAAIPAVGGDTGAVSVRLGGEGFLEGVDVRLAREGESDIIAAPVTIEAGGAGAGVTFDLAGRRRGPWDIVVANPDGASTTVPDGFTIEAGSPAEVWVDILGRDQVRAGRRQRYDILYGNRRNVDAVGVGLWIAGIPATATIDLGFDITHPDMAGVNWDDVPKVIEVDGQQVIPLLLPGIPAGFTGSLEIGITVPAGTPPFTLEAWVNQPLYQSPVTPETIDCLRDAFRLATDFLPGIDCLLNLFDQVSKEFADQVYPGGKKIFSWTEFAFRITLQCAGDVLPVAKAIEVAVDIVKAILAGQSLGEACGKAFGQFVEVLRRIVPVFSLDPNDKIGAAGSGPPLYYVSGREPLRYTIFFENVESATAPAQEVVIADQLDVSKLDLSTFDFGPVSFGRKVIEPPVGGFRFATDLDLRPTNNLLVRVTGVLNTNTGALVWRFSSIDPDTGLLPSDPLAGFLPPNVTPPEGDGSVVYTVKPLEGLETGAEIRNRASIVFDANPAIVTPEWLNTINQPRCSPIPEPESTCRLTAPGQSSIRYKDNRSNDAKDMFVWRWTSGEETLTEDFRNPVASGADYRVCVYDSSTSPQPIMESQIHARNGCGGEDCWHLRRRGKGFRYKDPTRTPDGIVSAVLKSGRDGKARVVVSGKGKQLGIPDLPLTPPVVVQFLVNDGRSRECWQTQYLTTIKNDEKKFKAAGP